MERKVARQNKFAGWLFILYIVGLTWIILFKMELSLQNIGTVRSLNWIPYAEPTIINNKVNFTEMYMNILAFVPFGIYSGMVLGKWPFWAKCLTFIGTSFLYEWLQYALAIGRSDITDFINNSLGGLIGLLLYMLLCKLFKEQYKANRMIIILSLVGAMMMLALMAILLMSNITYRFN